MNVIPKLLLYIALACAALSARSEVTLLHDFPFDGDYRDVAGDLAATPVPDTVHLQAPEFVADSPNGKGKSLSTGLVDGKRAGVLIPNLKLPAESGTVSVWVKSRAVASKDGASFIFFLPPSGTGGLNLALRAGSTVLVGAAGDSGPILTDNAGELGTWRNIVLTWDIVEKKTKLYSNGILVKESTLGKGPAGNGVPARVGGFDLANKPAAKETHFDGLISSLRIYRGAMSPAEIAREFSPAASADPAAAQSQAAIASDKITVARVFSSNMVLQRDSKVPVWGTGAENTSVTVEFAGQSKTTAVRSGRWEIVLDPMKASATGRDLRIEAAGDETILKDVLVGDVWLATGQSNMQLALAGSKDPEKVIAAPQNPLIRLFITPMSLAPGSADLPAAWQQASSESVGRLSAVAYYFANSIQPVAGVPVGLIQCAYGGSRVEAWASPELMKRDLPGYQNYLRTRPEGFFKKTPQVQASIVYERMLSPLFPFAVKGTIWYQGEGNSGTPSEYAEIFPLFIEEFRTNFRNPDMPFYFVQLPRLVKANWAPIRQAQLDIWKATRNTFMAVTIDIPMDFEPTNVAIHPSIKKPVGERLALAARHYVYGETSIVPSGPRVISATRSGSTTRIAFDFAEGGLVTSDGGPIKGLFGGPSAKSVLPLKAKIDGGALIIDHAEGGAAELNYIRYGSEADAPGGIIECNLANKSGLPASPFMLQVQ